MPFFLFSCNELPEKKKGKATTETPVLLVPNSVERARQLNISRFKNTRDSISKLAIKYTKANGFNEDIFFVADLNVHSGLPRFAVINLKEKKVLAQDLVAHGGGGRWYLDKPKFSNVPNSKYSSPGRYKVGEKYDGRFGNAYKLHGLDKTNSKAFDRFIVLHSYGCVPDKGAVFPQYLCCSEGCQMVSNAFLAKLEKYIDKSPKPILLWVVGN